MHIPSLAEKIDMSLYVTLLHKDMVDKTGKLVTTSLTMIDVHDIARSSRTYNVDGVFIAHPSQALRRLARILKSHWDVGHGSTYNPNRKEALDYVHLVSDLDEAIMTIHEKTGKFPKLVATSAKDGGDRVSFGDFKEIISKDSETPYLIMFGTGWGMCDELLARASIFLKPINGPAAYNHLSVRSACAIVLDRIAGS